jgi:lipopolysaccharide cholinephosphotransferase
MRITLKHMQKLHAIQLDMFQELKRVMDELDVRYYFVHGSLLSAVTTHRFIEEDDDIDIAIFRKDYERLLEKGNEIVSPDYLIQGSKNDDFPISFAKFRKNGTEFRQPILTKHDCHKGIYIDIFPIDYVPNEESFSRKYKTVSMVCSSCAAVLNLELEKIRVLHPMARCILITPSKFSVSSRKPVWVVGTPRPYF